ncbi:MAG: P-II family nitrogen regulator [Clostridium sp.]|uniref:P-II family nitrogen regulator n=1 Tax=Clostridium sp. DSM 8431 TaxID=1761781 RepID=UPI0008E615A0|nr:P-II family nitrogen regulator [Clostridium sp. DSM 8431]MCR4943280.1 P-II family nitrogen regulator [Clostridium sp.]SFU49380.1 nitrogen regulatory protein P-II family [Clostridium sp. DSM 8431]
MKKIEAIIRPTKLEELKDALIKSKITGITITQVLGCGQQMGWTENYRSNKILINVLPKVQIKIVVEDEKVEEVVNLIISIARTNEVGDGKIFVTDICDCIRIRTGERGAKAV